MNGRQASLRTQHGGFGLGLVVGLLLGLAIALGVALYVTKTPMQLVLKGASAHGPDQEASEAERNRNWDPNAALAGKTPVRPLPPDAASAPASDAAAGVPRGPGAPVLPTPADNGQVVPLSAASAPRSHRDAAAILNGQDPAAAPTSAADQYFVQVGAYGRAEDAEQQRAKLALAGLRASVSQRDQNGHTVHRVRLGPFDNKDDAVAQLQRARATDPEATLVRLDRSKP